MDISQGSDTVRISQNAATQRLVADSRFTKSMRLSHRAVSRPRGQDRAIARRLCFANVGSHGYLMRPESRHLMRMILQHSYAFISTTTICCD